jgi:CCR4-NOT transcriptional regulation complex NOT5 subunit
MLDRSYNTMKSDFENDHYNPKHTKLKVDKLISKFSDNTLFFIFYYQQDTYSQMLAAEELTKRRWYYQPKFQTWFRDNESVDKNSAQKPIKSEKLYFDFGPEWTIKRVKIASRQQV